MKHHTSESLRALGLLAVMLAGSVVACTEGLPDPVSGRRDGTGIRLELSIFSGDRSRTVVVALNRSPLKTLLSAAPIDRSSRSSGPIDRIRRSVALARALGRAAWAVLRHRGAAGDPGANGTTREGSDADRRRPA